MTHLSKRRLDKETYTQVLDSLDIVLGKLKKDEVRAFLFSLMSGTERLMVAKRFAAIALIDQGVSTSTISDRLNMTRATVSKLAMIMKIKDKGFAVAFGKVKQDQAIMDMKDVLLGVGKLTAEILLTHRIKAPSDYPRSKR